LLCIMMLLIIVCGVRMPEILREMAVALLLIIRVRYLCRCHCRSALTSISVLAIMSATTTLEVTEVKMLPTLK